MNSKDFGCILLFIVWRPNLTVRQPPATQSDRPTTQSDRPTTQAACYLQQVAITRVTALTSTGQSVVSQTVKNMELSPIELGINGKLLGLTGLTSKTCEWIIEVCFHGLSASYGLSRTYVFMDYLLSMDYLEPMFSWIIC